MGSAALREAVKVIRDWSMTPPGGATKASHAIEAYGSLAFNDGVQRARLPKEVYRALRQTIERGQSLDAAAADTVATAMKDWAVEHGATHYTHWFQPMSGITAERHDSFLTPTADGRAIAEFNGRELIRGEPDASSFPNGGMRSTFEARGYTAWDPTSPPWLLKASYGCTLVIPSAFVSWTGEALDKKTPLLRSIEALSTQALRVLRLLGSAATRVQATCGPEQEYFLIERTFYLMRPDLINAGRTLFGARPPKGQEMEDQYFGSIPERVLACMMEVEDELYKCGVPVRTRHNEVAPSQYEVAPLFEHANVAIDHQMMTMEVLKRVAPKFGLACLLHEKPFAGVNGSGKHLNWSLADEFGNNLLNPGDTPEENIQFLLFCAAMLRAVDRFQGLLRASIASAGNDHRLGANEAPPAIISVFLGDQLTEIFDQIEAGNATAARRGGVLDTGATVLPKLARDAGDRNRTSPFAFTGNKFEFRAVSSSQNAALPAICLNLAMSEALDHMATALEAAVAAGEPLERAVRALLAATVRDHKRIIFNGNGYSDEWREEAARRGLLNLRDTVEALPQLVSVDVLSTFERYRVMNGREVRARYDVAIEAYNKTINVEAQLMVLMAHRYILPASLTYQTQVASNVNAVKAAGASATAGERMLRTLCDLNDAFEAATADLARAVAHTNGSPENHARYARDEILPRMVRLRDLGDRIECVLPSESWPLPTYREMLFIK